MTDQSAQPASQKKMKAERARRVFLKAIEGGHSIIQAAALTGFSKQAFFQWKWTDEDFAEDWAAASSGRVISLETSAMQVAKSNTPAAPAMICFLLAAMYPERYCSKVRSRRWKEAAAKRAAENANKPSDGVVDALMAQLDEFEAAKIAQGHAALDPLLA